MIKVYAKQLAHTLRQEGHSYNFIAKQVHVSKGTLSVWLAGIPYTPNAETVLRIGKARAASGAIKSLLKRKSIEEARIQAVAEMGKISQRDLFMAGLGLYIGEGAKSDQTILFVNSNPAIINLIIQWFTRGLKIPRENLRLRVHLYPDNDNERSLRYWSKITNIPRNQFQKTIVDRRTDKKAVKAGKLPHGTAHLKALSNGKKTLGVFLARKIAAWSDRVLDVSRNAGVV
ncbi:MAG: hypothetical protein Q8R25_04055 [bacterium]|nr:hypothetical protein [bacterium]